MSAVVRPLFGDRPDIRREVAETTRNPLLALPAAHRVRALPPEAKAALRALLLDLATDAENRAQRSWRTRKAPMAAYWRAVAVYARHAARIAR